MRNIESDRVSNRYLGGIDYLQDLNRGPHPTAIDPTITKAWAPDLFAYYLGGSQTLEATDEEALSGVVDVLRIGADFSTGPNPGWLTETGYTVLTKAHHSGTALSLGRQLSAQAS